MCTKARTGENSPGGHSEVSQELNRLIEFIGADRMTHGLMR